MNENEQLIYANFRACFDNTEKEIKKAVTFVYYVPQRIGENKLPASISSHRGTLYEIKHRAIKVGTLTATMAAVRSETKQEEDF